MSPHLTDGPSPVRAHMLTRGAWLQHARPLPHRPSPEAPFDCATSVRMGLPFGDGTLVRAGKLTSPQLASCRRNYMSFGWQKTSPHPCPYECPGSCSKLGMRTRLGPMAFLSRFLSPLMALACNLARGPLLPGGGMRGNGIGLAGSTVQCVNIGQLLLGSSRMPQNSRHSRLRPCGRVCGWMLMRRRGTASPLSSLPLWITRQRSAST